MIYLNRADSLNEIEYFNNILHKSSTDLPIFLQYENLDCELNNSLNWKHEYSLDIFNNFPLRASDSENDEKSPSFINAFCLK